MLLLQEVFNAHVARLALSKSGREVQVKAMPACAAAQELPSRIDATSAPLPHYFASATDCTHQCQPSQIIFTYYYLPPP